jgi:hypothetical protein
MYINKIDELIEKIINDLYFVSLENKQFAKILKEPDYIKYQKEINEIMVNFIKKIDFNEIKELVKSNDAVNQVMETIKKYTAFYIFLMIGFFYNEKEDKYINNIVEFSKNQTSYNFKIENFFNSESNALLLKYNTMIQNILTLLNADQHKIDKIKVRPDFKETILFLNNDLGADFIEQKFKLKNLKNNVNIQAHNIIKTIIIKLIYGINDKRDFFKILEMSEVTDGEYMFIDIILPVKTTVDFSTIENMLGNDPGAKNTAYQVWKYMTDYEEKQSLPPMSNDEKILELINSGIVVPITDDFLLFHKDSEKYDKSPDPAKIKKKEDTKIKYIVNKIDKVRELYSESVKNDEKIKNEIKKLFYTPLLNRKAILVNIKEDISIINKFINVSRQNIENLDFFKDFEHYKTYPYINFADFEKYGFSIALTKTVNIVRRVSFEKIGDFKQIPPYGIVQTRVGSKDMTVNVVGFMIPSTIDPLQCVRIKHAVDVRKLDEKNDNGLELTLKYLRETYMNIKKHISSVVWFFDEELDKFETKSYEQISKFTMQDKIKHMASELYDKVQNEIKNAIMTIFSKNKNLSIQEGYKIIQIFKKNIMKIMENSPIYTDIENNLFDSIVHIEPLYDKSEDKIYDTLSESILTKKPPNLVEDKKSKMEIVKINLSSIDEFGEIAQKETIAGICQHNITKDKIDSINKKDFKKYSDELYKFIQQYVTVDIYNEYICKSCGYRLDIKQYIEDGEYDDETRTFVSFSIPINISLEDVVEYEKYKISVRNIDKIVEKIAIISNILHLSKGSVDAKSKRKLIVKNTIDLLLINNKKLKHSYKERENQITKLYGINQKYTNLFIFDLDNSIFSFSSKDIDKYKRVKVNNIIAYSIFFILLEINKSHVQFMGDDKKKICNFIIFDKIMDSLFGELKIIINTKGGVAPITNYKILCYMIYIISCTIGSQTKMWHYEVTDSIKKKEYIPKVQKALIHTLVDITNSVLEIGKDQLDHPLYGMNTSKFFKKLQDIYSDNELYNRLKRDTSASSSYERKESIILHKGYDPLSGKYVPSIFELPERRTCKCSTLLIPKLDHKFRQYYGISNLSNCSDGQYHHWITDKKKLVCKLCKVNADESKYDKSLSDEIRKKFKNILNINLAENICIEDGLPHIFEISKTGKEICSKCNQTKEHNYTVSELEKVRDVVEKFNTTKGENIINTAYQTNEKIKKNQDYISNVVKKLSSEFTKETEKTRNMKFLYDLTDEIQKVIGKELNDVNLTENMYVIDHDHLGNALENNIKILESQGKIIERLDHPYFKTDILYYTSHKYGKIDVFYDAHTKILLGYREQNKNYVLNKKHDKMIKLTYSLVNKFKLMGYTSQFISVDDMYTELTSGRDDIGFPNEMVTHEIIKQVIQNRITQLKKILFYFKMIISRILNNYSDEISPNDYYKIKISELIEKYSKKKLNPIMTDSSGNNLIFKHWKAVTEGVVIENLNNIKLNFDFAKNKSVHYNEINKIDTSGNMLTFYIVKELLKFFKYNEKNKVLVTTISHFIVDFFNTIFDILNKEKENEHIDVKRFKYALESTTNVLEIEEKSSIKILEGILNEYVDADEKTKEQEEADENEQHDDIERQDALDVDVDMADVDEAGEEHETSYDLGRNLEPMNID